MLPFMDELNGRIDPGYARVEERIDQEMNQGILSGTDALVASEIPTEANLQARKDIRQAKFALIVTEAIIEASNNSKVSGCECGGGFSELILNNKFTDILNTATRALLEVK